MPVNQPWRLALLALAAPLLLAGCDDNDDGAPEDFALEAQFLGRYSSGLYLESAAEIVAFHAGSERLFSVNAAAGAVDVLSLADPATPELLETLDVTADIEAAEDMSEGTLGGVNSVAVNGNLIAVAVEADDKQANGYVAFYNATTLAYIAAYEVGALPDNVVFTPDGRYALTANEGEPNSYNQEDSVDPEGSVSIIDLADGAGSATVSHATFETFNVGGPRHFELPRGVRIYGPNASVAQDLEPEYVAVSPDSSTAWVSLQENNAMAIIDIASANVIAIRALGFKDHSMAGNEFDGSDRDGPGNTAATSIASWPVYGMYQPDTIKAFAAGGETWIISANEGDARDYDGFAEEARVSSRTLDASAFPTGAALKTNAQIGRLTITTTLGDYDDDGEYEALYALGGRSFSIWNSEAELVWDSGSQLERTSSDFLGNLFNLNHETNESADTRSDNKGPEPEAVDVGRVGHKRFAFIANERDSLLNIYDVTDPTAPVFNHVFTGRDFDVNTATIASDPTVLAAAGDLGPESVLFISAGDSPNGRPLLVVGNEVSGTVAVWQLNRVAPPAL